MAAELREDSVGFRGHALEFVFRRGWYLIPRPRVQLAAAAKAVTGIEEATGPVQALLWRSRHCGLAHFRP